MARTCLTRVSLLSSCSRLHAHLPINLPSWDTHWRTTDDILSIVGAPGRGVRLILRWARWHTSRSSARSRRRPCASTAQTDYRRGGARTASSPLHLISGCHSWASPHSLAGWRLGSPPSSQPNRAWFNHMQGTSARRHHHVVPYDLPWSSRWIIGSIGSCKLIRYWGLYTCTYMYVINYMKKACTCMYCM